MKELKTLDNETFLRSVDRSNPEVRELAERCENLLQVLKGLLTDFEHSMNMNTNRIENYRESLINVRNKFEEKLNANERDD